MKKLPLVLLALAGLQTQGHVAIGMEKNTHIAKPPSSQAESISGTIRDTKGDPIVGATIIVKGSAVQTASDANGQFTIKAKPGDTLIISYVSYLRKEITIAAGQDRIAVTMQENAQSLDQVVVTALGLKRAERALNYNVQIVKNEELVRVKDANFVNSLAGKIAGVTINSSSTGIGGAARVIMRGAKSIKGDNNALYVIDGVIAMNSTSGSNEPAGKIGDIYSANTGSEIMSTINPEDIESISALTGAAASALYGSLGQNGVILITTKSGNKNNKTTLSAYNNSMFFNPLVMPEFQNTYGTTDDGSFFSWGNKLATSSTYKPRDFFQTGNNTTFGLNFSTGTEKNQTYISAAQVSGNGIIPNNKLKRYNVSFRNTAKFLNDKMTSDVNIRYSSQHEQNMIAQGLYHNPLVPIYLFPPGSNIEAFKVYERYDLSRNYPTQYWPNIGDQFRTENPWWIINRESYENFNKRLLMSFTLNYDVTDWLKITGRANMDRVDGKNSFKRYASTDNLFAGYGGSFGITNNTAQKLYADLMANIKKNFGDFTLTANLGGQRTEDRMESLSAGGDIDRGSPPNIFTTDNVAGNGGVGAGAGIARQPDRNSFQSLYGLTSLSYKNMLFLDASYRTDWYSQLYFNPQSKLYLTYPAFGTSAIVTDLFNVKSPILSYAKVRANYAEVGKPPERYDGGPQVFLLNVGNIDQNSPLHYPLQPERTKSWELGTNLKFWNNKINLDITLYTTKTLNQIFTVRQSASSGGNSSFLINAGRVDNKGIEANLGHDGTIGPVRWISNIVYTLNRTRVNELFNTKDANGNAVSVPYLDVAGGGSYLQRLSVGSTLSPIYTTSHLMLDQNGYVNLPLAVDGSKQLFVGNSDPKYTVGWNNSFNYKSFSLNFQLFARVGGVGISATQAMMDAYGVSKTSADARDIGEVTVNGQPYTDVQKSYSLMGSGLEGVLSNYVYSATNVRLRELSFGYSFPGKMFGNTIKNLKLAVTGNNLWMIYNKAPFDPESTASSGTYYQGFDYFRQPSLRGFGFSINAQF
ncbi:hypothetical protein BWD42_07585 [Sphingobacterium sp. CZ-UAM]|uniref:SusC/RagA family TonB-linked outer membrane protein n=1 Tax=Sphingobacterium sp. CZ-UAM TaxID=1933868 RepID=UPI0009D09110|nr:SusC/RagA family TonB-linked outer membrane protein [Sphingobacterium sp. CZ-UAM]OOG19754.1 hypothetical protein BWD42_07585 [Sphingobacterium sp. CZ-UAM]